MLAARKTRVALAVTALVSGGLVTGYALAASTPATHNKPESSSLIQRSIVAAYGVSGTHSGLGVGVFDRRTGKVLQQLSLTHFQNRAFGNWSTDASGDLLYAESDLGPQSGAAVGPTSGCDGNLYELDRKTGATHSLFHAPNENVNLPAAGLQPTTWAVEVHNCPETRTWLRVDYQGKTVHVPAAVRSATPVDWTADGRTLLLEGSPDSVDELTFTATGSHLTQRLLPHTAECTAWLAAADRFGLLAAQNCTANADHGTWLLQVRAHGNVIAWKQRLPFCDTNLSIDTNASGSQVLASNGLRGHCENTYGHYQTGTISRTGITFTPVISTRRFFDLPTI